MKRKRGAKLKGSLVPPERQRKGRERKNTRKKGNFFCQSVHKAQKGCTIRRDPERETLRPYRGGGQGGGGGRIYLPKKKKKEKKKSREKTSRKKKKKTGGGKKRGLIKKREARANK